MAAPPGLGAVEVQKDTRSSLWYCGFIRELAGQGDLMVSFEAEVWPAARYHAAAVRKPPKQSAADLEAFDPQVGDEVELRVAATPHSPAYWAVGVVKNIKHDFYFVTVGPSPGQRGNEAIVEKDMLRPVSHQQCLSPETMNQETFKLPAPLQSWTSTEDAAGCFSHIQDQSGLVTILVQPAKSVLKLIGDPKATMRAKMLLDVHVKHQAQIQNFQDVREKRLKALESKRSRIEGSGYKNSCEFKVDASFIARIIGKGGESIRALQEKHDVTVRILDGDSQEADKTVRIFGNQPENVEKARAEVEIVEEAMEVEPESYSWLLGRGGKTIQGFRENAGLVYARLDRDSHQLLLCGSRHAVDDALALFETHIMYYPVFHQMDEEMDNMFVELEEYGDWDARKEWGCYRDDPEDWQPKGRGKGKGQDWWDGGGKWDSGGRWDGGGGGKGDGKARSSSKGGKGEPPASSRSSGAAANQRNGKARDSAFGAEDSGLRLPKGKGKKTREIWLGDEGEEAEEAEQAKGESKGSGRGGRARAARMSGREDSTAGAEEASVRTVRRQGKMGVRA